MADRVIAGVRRRQALQSFDAYQAARDRNREWRDYIASTALRLMSHDGKPALERALQELWGWPHKTPSSLEWSGKHYRIGAIVPRGIVPGATHALANEIVAHEITEAEPLRDYERAAPYQIFVRWR